MVFDFTDPSVHLFQGLLQRFHEFVDGGAALVEIGSGVFLVFLQRGSRQFEERLVVGPERLRGKGAEGFRKPATGILQEGQFFLAGLAFFLPLGFGFRHKVPEIAIFGLKIPDEGLFRCNGRLQFRDSLRLFFGCGTPFGLPRQLLPQGGRFRLQFVQVGVDLLQKLLPPAETLGQRGPFRIKPPAGHFRRVSDPRPKDQKNQCAARNRSEDSPSDFHFHSVPSLPEDDRRFACAATVQESET